MAPKRRFWNVEKFDRHLYGSFKGVITRFFGPLAIEKGFEKTHRTFRSAIENLRFGSIKLSTQYYAPL